MLAKYNIDQRLEIYAYLYFKGLYKQDMGYPFFMCLELNEIGVTSIQRLHELNNCKHMRGYKKGSKWFDAGDYEPRLRVIETAIAMADKKLKSKKP